MQNSTSTAYRVPEPIAKALQRLPRYPGSILFVSGLNLMLVRHLHPDTLHMLENRSLRIHVADARLLFDYTWRDRAFRAASHGDSQPDLTIRAEVADFHALLRRVEDPDTLFFSRRLVIEGDTELGLMVKNTLDSIDMEVFRPKVVLRDVFSSIRARMRGFPSPAALFRAGLQQQLQAGDSPPLAKSPVDQGTI